MKLGIVLLCGLIVGAECGTSSTVNTTAGVLNYDEDWDYVQVRPGAHSFWWLYAVKPANDSRPLVLWMQGGPGGSSVGYGNFEEIGPKALEDLDRPLTWLQYADLVFVDNPVGTGFSYVENDTLYATDVKQIGKDLLEWARAFFTKHGEYKSRPFFIVCESYGGKMGAEFARVILEQLPVLGINFKGVALGDSWISPIDYITSWGPYLYSQSYLDEAQLKAINDLAATCQNLVDTGNWTGATDCYYAMEDTIDNKTNGVSWYNILKKSDTDHYSLAAKMEHLTPSERSRARHISREQADTLAIYMNGPIRKKLGIIPANVFFGNQSDAVFAKNAGDFMTPNVDTVDLLLSNGTNVIIMNGQLDLICDTPGTEKWMDRLRWRGMAGYKAASKKPFSVPNGEQTGGFSKKYQNLQMFYILRAGHMITHDSPEVMLQVLKDAVQTALANTDGTPGFATDAPKTNGAAESASAVATLLPCLYYLAK